MYAIEFQTRVKDGTIEIPEMYHFQVGEQVRVILLTETQPAVDEETQPGSVRPLTAAELLQSGLVGIWADREDITSSQEFARRLRQQAEHRERDVHA